MNRVFLTLEEMPSLRTWLNDNGIKHRGGGGEYEVIQILNPGFGYRVIFRKKHGSTLTVPSYLVPLIEAFLDSVAPVNRTYTTTEGELIGLHLISINKITPKPFGVVVELTGGGKHELTVGYEQISEEASYARLMGGHKKG